MAKLPIHWIEARTYAHATEDEARVSAALAFALPEGESVREVLEGHFGNVLVRLTRRIEDGKSIRAIWERWSLAKDSDAIDVRLKLVAYPAKPEIARRVARSILEGAV